MNQRRVRTGKRFVSAAEAKNAGYEACQVCFPPKSNAGATR